MKSMGTFLKRVLCAAPIAFLWAVTALAQQSPDAAASAAAGSATPALNTGDTAWMLTSTALVSLILLKIVDLTIGLRVDADVEREGLDLAPHGEAVQ